MRKIILLLTVIFSAVQINAQSVSAMSFNIRYDNPGDGINRWDQRKELVTKTITDYKPDFIGIQEALDHQMKYIDDKLAEYTFIGVGRDDGETKGEYSAIFYRNDIFSLLNDSTIWLSETPEKVSVGWDASMERICTFGRFMHRQSKKEIIVLNTHLDHMGSVAREKSALLIMQTIQKLTDNNTPIILCGDFNATPDEQPIKTLMEFFAETSCKRPLIKGATGTYTGFSPGAVAEKRIDYIFTINTETDRYLHISNINKDGKYISDHLPVYATGVF